MSADVKSSNQYQYEYHAHFSFLRIISPVGLIESHAASSYPTRVPFRLFRSPDLVFKQCRKHTFQVLVIGQIPVRALLDRDSAHGFVGFGFQFSCPTEGANICRGDLGTQSPYRE